MKLVELFVSYLYILRYKDTESIYFGQICWLYMKLLLSLLETENLSIVRILPVSFQHGSCNRVSKVFFFFF